MSSLGGDSRAGKSPASNKLKSFLSTYRASDSNYTLVTNKKNSHKSNSNLLTPTSPELRHIIDNTPILNTLHSTFSYIDPVSTDNNLTTDLQVINNGLYTDNFNDSTWNSVPDVNSTRITPPIHTTDTSNDIILSSQGTQQSFSFDYNGLVILLVECIDLNKNL